VLIVSSTPNYKHEKLNTKILSERERQREREREIERTVFKCHDWSQLLWLTNEKTIIFFKKLGLVKTTVSSLHCVCPFAALKPIFL
jgi:hypothetical protein